MAAGVEPEARIPLCYHIARLDEARGRAKSRAAPEPLISRKGPNQVEKAAVTMRSLGGYLSPHPPPA